MNDLIKAAQDILAILDAHEVDTLDCDRRGDIHCDCLDKAKEKLENALKPYGVST